MSTMTEVEERIERIESELHRLETEVRALRPSPRATTTDADEDREDRRLRSEMGLVFRTMLEKFGRDPDRPPMPARELRKWIHAEGGLTEDEMSRTISEMREE